MLSKIALATLFAAVTAVPDAATVTIGAQEYKLAFTADAFTVTGVNSDAPLQVFDGFTCEAAGTASPVSVPLTAADAGAPGTGSKFDIVGRAAKIGEACGVIEPVGALKVLPEAQWKPTTAKVVLKTVEATPAKKGEAELSWDSDAKLISSMVNPGAKPEGATYGQFVITDTCTGTTEFPAGAYTDLSTLKSSEIASKTDVDIFAYGVEDENSSVTLTLTTAWQGDFEGKKAIVKGITVATGEKAEDPVTATIDTCGDIVQVSAFNGFFTAGEPVKTAEKATVKVGGKFEMTSTTSVGALRVELVTSSDTDKITLDCTTDKWNDAIAKVAVKSGESFEEELELTDVGAELEEIEGNVAVVVRDDDFIYACAIVGGVKDTSGNGGGDGASEPNPEAGAASATVSLAAMTIMGAAMMN